MSNFERFPESMAIDLARECLYRFLAAALSDPSEARWGLALDPQNQQLACAAAELLRTEAGDASVSCGAPRVTLPVVLLDLEPLLWELQNPGYDARAEYDRVFGLVSSRECSPYETEYHPASEDFFRAQQLADIAGFYRAFGLDTRSERPDHIACELEFMALVLMKKRLARASSAALVPKLQLALVPKLQFGNEAAAEHARICNEAQRSFFQDHLAWWVLSFAMGLRRKGGAGFYADVAQVLAAFLPVERHRLGVTAPRRPRQPLLIERPEEQAECAACPSLCISPQD